MIWLWEHLFNSLSEVHFINSDIEVVMLHNGVVAYTRIPC